MKFQVDKEAKKKIVIGVSIAFLAILFYFFLLNLNGIRASVDRFFRILFPFTVGFVIAFLLNPLMMWLENKLFGKWRINSRIKRNLAASISVLIGIVAVSVLVLLIASSMQESVNSLIDNHERYLESFERFLENMFLYFRLDLNDVANITASGEDFMSMIINVTSKFAPDLLGAGFGFVFMLLKILIGIIAGLYMLMDKEKFLYQGKKLNYALFPKVVADYLNRFVNVLRNIFYDFIVGKAIDSFIIGIICYAGMLLFGFEYAVLISVIIGITNMIPVFGPFIGAIPGAFILLIVNPIQALYFLIFVFVLQQFDGNFLGPYILGDKLGIPSFWILFSVTVGGALFGIIGMFIGVPVFAAIYFLVKEFVNYRLEKKAIDL